MKVTLYTQKGNQSKTQIEVSDELFAGKVNEKLLAQYVYVYLSNQREAIAHAKDRSEVSGGGVKPWRQKGTGRARAGSNRSPIWTKGGVTFGPTNQRNWKKNISKKMKRGALRSALAKLATADKVRFVDAIKFEDDKLTKQAAEFATNLKLGKKFTVLVPGNDAAIVRAFANIPKAKVVSVTELNAYDILNAGELVIAKDALEFMQVWA